MVYFGTSEGWKDFRPPVSWHKGEWNFIAFSWKQGTSDLGQLRVTVNEEQFGTMLPSMSKPARAALIASARPAGIDEVAIFKRALTDEDIVRLYKGGLAGKSLPEIFAGQLVQHAPPISGADAQRSSLAIREVGKFPGRRSVACVQFTPDGRFVLGACQDDLKVWETETGRLVRTMQAGEQILSLAVSPDGKHVVTGLNSTFELALWDIASGEEIHRLAGHEERPYGLAFSADGTRLFSKGVDRTLREWDLERGQPVKAYAQASGYNNLLRLIPGGDQLLTTSTDDGAMLGIFDVNSGAVVRKFLGSYRGQSRGLDMTTDGARAVTSSTEGILRIWDVAEGRELQQINTGDYQPYQVTFVPGGRFIVSGGIDETEGQWSVRLWDVMTGAELARWKSSEPTLTVAVANSGRYVATCGSHHDDKQGPARLLELPPSVWAPGDPDTEAGWVSLFNGRDLSGWKKHPDAPSGWTVEDGLLVGQGGPDTYLFSEHHDYKDFHLRVEAKVNDAGDSGDCHGDFKSWR